VPMSDCFSTCGVVFLSTTFLENPLP